VAQAPLYQQYCDRRRGWSCASAGRLDRRDWFAHLTVGRNWAPIVLFAIIFYWTPPHFWALAIKYKDDYAAADVPMLPAVADLATVTRRIVGYTVLLWALTLVFGPVADMGMIYLVSAAVLGAVFLGYAIRVARDPQPGPAMALFGWSITYVVLLFGAMAVDQLV
jgi:protoheme IX farnesyltransferase